MIDVYGSENIQLDHVTIFGGFPALLINASKNIRLTHSAIRGLAAPWISRAHMKYRGTASYQIILQNSQPLNDNIEFAWCEFTDDHDFAFLHCVSALQFHHNFVDNFNDDGLECGPKLRAHRLFISQNRIGRCLMPLTQHEIDKDASPLDHDPQAGVFLFRNVIDLRGGGYKSPPAQPDTSGSFLREEEHLVGDHGSPTWVVMHVYQNTLLRDTPIFRDQFLFGLGAAGLHNTERDIFNNIFVQTDRVPGVAFVGMRHAENVREGGNILWGMKEGPTLKRDVFSSFRSSRLFEESRTRYEPGWTTQDRSPIRSSSAFRPIARNRPISACKPTARPSIPEWSFRRNGRTRCASWIRANRTSASCRWGPNRGELASTVEFRCSAADAWLACRLGRRVG